MAEQVVTVVHVSNINYLTTARELDDAFRPYGEVMNARIVTRHQQWGGERSAGYGFIDFATAESAAAAIAADPQIVVGGRTLRVELARSPRPPQPESARLAPTERDSPPAERTMLHVSGIPKGTTQDDLQAVFGKYNPVEIHIMREDSDERRGFAFVRFDSEEHQAAAAYDENRAFQLNGGETRVEWARNSPSAVAADSAFPRKRKRPRKPRWSKGWSSRKPEGKDVKTLQADDQPPPDGAGGSTT
jgi:RNA recognition motif-containing protein